MLTVSKQAKLSTEELHEVKQLMGALLALLSFWSLSSLDTGSSAMLSLGGTVAVLAFCFPRWVARIPPVAWHWTGPVLLIVIAADFFLHMPSFMPPLVRMVIWLTLYRVLAPRNIREDKQMILLCLFSLVISGVLTVSFLFALQILLFAPLAMALLFVICLLDRGSQAPPVVLDWEQFKWIQLLRRVWSVLDLRVALLCSMMFILVVAVSSLLFILTPRFDFNQSIPFLDLNTQAKSGFSEDVTLGEVTEIQEDNSVALRIDVPSLDAVSHTPYWRMLVLDEYGDGRFRVSQSLRGKPLRLFEETRELRSAVIPVSQRSGDFWTFYMEGGISRYLPLPGDYASLRFQKYQDVEMVPDVHVLGLDAVGQNVFSYQVEDLKFNHRFASSTQEQSILGASQIDDETQRPLVYPLTTMELSMAQDSVARLTAINSEIINEASMDVLSYSKLLTDFLWRNFSYSLLPNGGEQTFGDPIVSWLETGSQGHCELFAGAFILLAREAGYPARMVVGYAGGTWNSLEDYFVVRNRDAHAWVEIFDAEEGTWLRVDPTPGRGSSDPEVIIPRAMEFESGWSAWVDSLRIQWYRRVVNFEQKDQVEMAMIVRDVWRDYYAQFKETLRGWGLAIKSIIGKPLDVGSIRPLAFVLVLSSAIYFTWRTRYLLLSLLYRVLRRPSALDPVRRQASRFLKLLKVQGIESDVVLRLQALRFGPETSSKDAERIFEDARRVLKKRD